MAVLGHPAQDVVGAGQGDGEGIVGLLHLVLGHGGRAVVRHGGGLDEDVRLGQQILHRPEHVRRRGHRPGVHEGDQGQAGGAGDQGDLGPPEHGLPGDGIPHPAGAVVGEEAHRVQGLLGGAGGHRHPHPLEGLGPGQLPGDVIQEDLRLGHLSAAHRLAGQQAAVRRDDLKAVALQGLQVVLGDGVFQHGGVHGWGHQLLALGRQDHGGEHVVCNAVGQLGDDIRRGRGNEDQVRCRGQGDVMDVVGKVPVKSVHHAAVVGEGLEGQGGDELRGIPGHHHVDLRPRLPQGRGHVGDFVGGNAARDAQQYTLSLQVFHGLFAPILPPRRRACCFPPSGAGAAQGISRSRPCFS